MTDNVVQLDDRRGVKGHGGGGGRDDTGERLARIETEVKHLAKKEDVEKVNTNVASLSGKVTTIMWMTGIIATAMTTAVVAFIAKSWVPPPS